MDEESNEDAIKILARVRELPELSYRAHVLIDRALACLGMPDPDRAPRFTAADVRRLRAHRAQPARLPARSGRPRVTPQDAREVRRLLRRYELTGTILGLSECRIARLAIALSLVEFFSRLTRDQNRVR